MAYWTIQCNGQERQLNDWGNGVEPGLVLQRVNQAPDVLTLTVPDAADAALLFPYNAPAVVYRDRSSPTGNPGTFTGGTVWFRGKATLPERSSDGGPERIAYRFAGPWWDLERLVFQQEWRKFAGYTIPGDPTSAPTYTTARESELYLGRTMLGALMTNGEAAAEAVSWASACGVAVQLGTVDPAVSIPYYHVRDLTVAEVIIQMLRFSPDTIVWFDYATITPTLHMRKLANLVGVTVTRGVDSFRSLQLKPCYDLQLPAVVIKFKSTHDVDGFTWPTTVVDAFPAGADGTELGASVHTVDLEGGSVSTVSATLVTEAINASNATAATRLEWWRTHEQTLRSAKIQNLAITAASVTYRNRAGVAVTLATYPRELVSGQVADWMPYVTQTMVVSCVATYDVYSTDAVPQLIKRNVKEEVSVTVLATNAPLGTSNPSSVTSATAPEMVPVGMAQALYEAHQTLQHEGTVVLLDDEIPAGLGMGNKLTVAGLALPFSDMLIQSTTEEPFAGRLTLNVGPPTQLGIPDLIELLRVNRHRVVYGSSTSQRSEGAAAGSGSVELGKDTAKENTSKGGAASESLAAVSGTGVNLTAQLDAAGTSAPGATAGQPMLALYKRTADGAVDTTFARLMASLADLTGTNKEVKFRELTICVDDGAGGTEEKRAWFLCTLPED